MFPWFSPRKSSSSQDATATEDDPQTTANKSATTKPSLLPGFVTTPGTTALVTGSSGMCGARLVELLLERGAAHVIAFDICPPSAALQQRFDDAVQKAQQQGSGSSSKLTVLSGNEGDLTSQAAVDAAFAKPTSTHQVDVVYHIGALVGPYHDRDAYWKVNYQGTLHMIEACRKHKVPKLVYSSSPSTRFGAGFDGIAGQTEDELPMPANKKWLALYAETKALGEQAVSKAAFSDDANEFSLLTVSVAPHQVYGPYDSLMLPKLLETAGSGRLRIFGNGQNQISVTYVDNYAHGLLCAADALCDENSACLGKFYIVTDGPPPVYFWNWINQAICAMGFDDLTTKWHLPVWFLYLAAYVANVIGWCTGRKLKLNPFNVKMLTMDRYFSIANAQRDLKYQPIVPGPKAWQDTIQWFQENWLPGYLQQHGRTTATTTTKKTD